LISKRGSIILFLQKKSDSISAKINFYESEFKRIEGSKTDQVKLITRLKYDSQQLQRQLNEKSRAFADLVLSSQKSGITKSDYQTRFDILNGGVAEFFNVYEQFKQEYIALGYDTTHLLFLPDNLGFLKNEVKKQIQNWISSCCQLLRS
jgi:hypothetical protein